VVVRGAEAEHRPGDPGVRLRAENGADPGCDPRARGGGFGSQRRGHHPGTDGFADDVGQRVDPAAVLHDVVGGPELHRPDGDLLGARGGHHDDRHVGPGAPNRAQRAEPFGVGQPVVEDDAVDGARFEVPQPVGEAGMQEAGDAGCGGESGASRGGARGRGGGTVWTTSLAL